MQGYQPNIENVIRSSLTTTQQGQQQIVQSALTDIEGARQVARRLKETYDKSNTGYIDNMEVVSMIVDAYRSFNRVFNPSRQDIDSYFKVFDRDRDNKITLQDLEEVCIKYLCGTTTNVNTNLASSGFGVKTSESQLRQSYGANQGNNQNLQFTIGQQNFSNLMQQNQANTSSKYSSDNSSSDDDKKKKKK